MNFIPYNAVDGLGFQRPSWERAARWRGTLHRRGVLTKLRDSAGQDVDGGCGQLRSRTLPLQQPVAATRANAPHPPGAGAPQGWAIGVSVNR